MSLRASTVRQAQQTFSIAFFLLFIPLFALPLIPDDMKVQITKFIMNTNLEILALAFAGFIFILDIILFLIAKKQFKRNRLILD